MPFEKNPENSILFSVYCCRHGFCRKRNFEILVSLDFPFLLGYGFLLLVDFVCGNFLQAIFNGTEDECFQFLTSVVWRLQLLVE